MNLMMNFEDFDYLAAEPTVIRGTGNIVLFGLSNKFSPDLPGRLLSRVAPEEYKETIEKVNYVLDRKVSRNFKWFLCGCVFVCCTCGVSLWPSIHMSKHTKLELERLLKWENARLYNKLGLKWSLSKQFNGSPPMVEYVILIEIAKRPKIFWPD
ncbi:hypothetical protein HHI36_006115 [Cryptolaemus montrouzieri]|uniref:Golgin subfamily A member 7/ERF4 domain-containing protein n=1 Tax=Cryptolaemus montrouzieri TaxID=559131 RepID=A0ABD2NX39_9CUCU